MEKNIREIIEKEINIATTNIISNNMVVINNIDNTTAYVIKELTGITVTNRRQVLYDNDIRHMLNTHGNKRREKSRGQIAITKKDILKIPYILSKYDYIAIGSNNHEGQTIRYIKKYKKRIITIVEVIPKKSDLKIKTMWKIALDDSNTPILTPEAQATFNSTLSNCSIAKNKRNSKK